MPRQTLSLGARPPGLRLAPAEEVVHEAGGDGVAPVGIDEAEEHQVGQEHAPVPVEPARSRSQSSVSARRWSRWATSFPS